MNKPQEKTCKPFFSAEEAISAAKWDKNSPWTVLVNSLDGNTPWVERRTADKDCQKKSEK